MLKKFKQHGPPRKCKCFICGVEAHYAKESRNDKVKTERLNMYHKLELAKDINIVSVDSNDSDICSILGGNEVHSLIETGKMIDF